MTAVVERFYTAFAALDGDAMAACYAPDARFSDPVFPDLHGDGIGAMWRMLCLGARDWGLEYRVLAADADGARVAWTATYRFSATGRLVRNRVTSTLRIVDDRIVAQVDRFDFWRWSRQALGPPGLLLGWTQWLRHKVRAQAAARLAQFQQRA